LGNYNEDMLRIGDSLGFHNRPGARFQKWVIDSFGFRGPEITKAKPDSVVRVIVVGASESFGLGESPGMEYPAQMQRVLDSVAPGRYQVLNAACPGMTPPRIKYFFDNWLVQFDPDILVYYPSPSFYLDNQPIPDSMNIAAINRWRPKHSLRIVDKARIMLKRFIPHRLQTAIRKYLRERRQQKAQDGWVFTEIPQDRLKLFERHLRELIADVKSHGVRVIIGTHGNRFGKVLSSEDEFHLENGLHYNPRVTPEVALAFEPAANKLIENVAAADSCVLVDIARRVPKGGEYFFDAGHFNDRGASLVAHLFADAVLSEDSLRHPLTADIQ
ncbi:MAG: hypothetical protein D6800_10465, partial [Candidatus Zixiibacteriota bacterium]